MNIKEHYGNSSQQSYLEWSVMRSIKKGEKDCGDAYVVCENGDRVMIAVVDGLGHGLMASKASEKAIELLKIYSSQSPINVIKYCHKGLRRSRGVVMGLAVINCWEHTLAWIGVGNVKGILLLSDEENKMHSERMIQRSGIIGYKLPFLQVSMVPIEFNDVLIFATDGVEDSFFDHINRSNSPDEIVQKSSSSFKESDDALILAAKYKGGVSL